MRRAMCALSVVAVAVLAAVGASPASAALPASFGTLGSGAGQISGEAQGIAVDQETGDVYIGDARNQRVDKFDSEGNFLLAWGWGVADGTTEALQTCTTACFAGLPGSGDGQFANIFGAEGVAVDNSGGLSQGDVYVVDAANSRVQKFGPAGNFILAFGEEGTGSDQFQGLNHRSVAVGPAGTVYVADDNRVQRFSEAGAPLGEVAIPGGGAVNNLAVDSTGDIYLHGEAQEGVHKYDPSGTELGTPRDQAGTGESLAITVGPTDELFLNDYRGGEAGHHIFTFAPEGEQISSFDRGGLEQNGTRGIAYSEFTEALYVLNKGLVRIVTPPPPGPFVLAEAATEIGPATATLTATVNPEGAETTYRFQYGTTTAYGEATADATLPADFEDHEVSAPLTALAPRTIYHFRLLAESECEPLANPGHICITEGPDQSFETLPPVSVDATFATFVTATSATLNAELNPHGLPSSYRFEYGPTTAYGQSTLASSAGTGTTEVFRSAQVQGLAPETTYHFRVRAENSLGTSFGPDRSFTTQGAAASLLPDDRVWEMVTPPNKFGSPLQPITEEGGLLQSAVGGGAFTYIAGGPITIDPEGTRSPFNVQLLATRAPSGWSTQEITTPNEEVSVNHPGVPSEYKFFSEDLSTSVVEPDGKTPLSPRTTERTPYRRESDGEFVPLVTAENVPPGTKFGGDAPNGVEFLTATPDLSHVVLSSSALLVGGFPPGFELAGGLYEVSSSGVELVSILPDSEPTGGGVARKNLSMRGAISSNGSRLAFEANTDLYLRDIPLAQTLRLDEVQPEAAGGAGEAEFQAANADASKVFFTDTSRLTKDSTARPNEPDLYMCEVKVNAGELSCELSDLSIDPSSGEAANVFGGANGGKVSAIDASGSHVYFAANGVLTNLPNSRGEVAVPGVCNSENDSTCNLYEYDTAAGQISLVAVLSSQDDPDWAGRTNRHQLGNLTARSSPNGRYFTFMSRRSLTGYDNRDARSRQLDEEVFQYDSSSGQLSCVSCNPTGARPNGIHDVGAFPGLLVDHPHSWAESNTTGRWLAASIPGWTLGPALNLALYQSRYLSNSGRLFFNAADALVPQDTNGVMDVYQYEPPGVGDCTTSSSTYSPTSGGCVALISSGTSAEESAFLDASESGDDVFFLTQSKLASTDVDNAFDVYDAAVGGRTYETVKPVECSGDACQQPATPPVDPTPGSLTFQGAGNVLQCPKGKVKRSGKCVAKKAHKKKKHKAKSKRPAKHRSGK